MITIKDGIHGHIDVKGVAGDLLDTPVVQRLRRLKQLGTTSLVYPSANHSRFEHSLGVYYLANQVVERLELPNGMDERLRAAALLHDIGHGPFSHNTEPILRRRLGKAHDDVDDLLMDGKVRDILQDHGIHPKEIAGLIAGEGQYGQIISSELDIDRMDYLARDAHHTGVPYGTIDHERLIYAMTFVDSTLAIESGNLQVAESMLTSRALMNPTVYHHHAARISEIMLLRATETLLDEGVVSPTELRRMDDYDLMVALRRDENTQEMVRRIDNRNLYKRAVWLGIDAVPDSLVDADHGDIVAYEQEIAEAAGLDPELVILDIPDRPSIPESETKIITDGQPVPLHQRSSIIGALEAANREQWRLGVLTPAAHVAPVRKATDSILDLDTGSEFVDERKDNYSPVNEGTQPE